MEIILDPSTGILYTENLKQITNLTEPTHEVGSVKSDSPRVLKILLGHNCNLSCKYCLQHAGIGSCNQSNPDTLFKKIVKYINTVNLEEVQFWGGEPLLYWKSLKSLMSYLDQCGLKRFSMVTNGTLLDAAKIEFFNDAIQTPVSISISHDAHNHADLRGVDFLSEKAHLLKKIQKFNKNISLSFNVMLSNGNFDLFKMDDYFSRYFEKFRLEPIFINYSLIEAHDSRSKFYVIQGENLSNYRKILGGFIQATMKGYMLPNNLVHGIDTNCVRGLTQFLSNPFKQYGVGCDSDQVDVLTIDMEGNVLPCQNLDLSHKSGSINKLKDVRMNFCHRAQCEDCKVLSICRYGCPIVEDENLFLTNCNIFKTHYAVIQEITMDLISLSLE